MKNEGRWDEILNNSSNSNSKDICNDSPMPSREKREGLHSARPRGLGKERGNALKAVGREKSRIRGKGKTLRLVFGTSATANSQPIELNTFFRRRAWGRKRKKKF